MREVKHYICEICGTEYNDKNKCAECEKNHVKIDKIDSVNYVSYQKDKSGYPSTVQIEMSDGEIVIYKRY